MDSINTILTKHKLSRMQNVILEALNHGRPLSSEDLMHKMNEHQDRISLSPTEHDLTLVRVTIHQMNKRLRPLGYVIRSSRQDKRYRLLSVAL